MATTILIAFLSVIGLLILHEFGHFILAKRFGVKIEEFGIFLPPRLIGKKIGETIYSLNLIPLGAFVKIHGETGEAGDDRSFVGKPIWQRVLIVLGGVVSFWLIAIILLSIVFSMGATQVISDQEPGPLVNPKVQIISIAPGSPAQIAGLRLGDTITSLRLKIKNEKLKINKVKEVQEFMAKYKGEEVLLTIERGREVFDVSLIPRVSPPAGEGAMGVGLIRTAEKSYPWPQAFIKGLESTANLTYAVITGWSEILGNLIKGEGLPKGVQFVGPIGVGVLITQAAQVGINYFLQFIAIIAIYLAIFNILPIPALDGGKLLFLGIEKIKGRPVNQKIEQNITAGFFVVLIALMIWVTIKDITRLF